ncbi:MAG: hypothetical protein HDS68_01320 [Bacteroidales bacterium]|nr:hypothetical protein [Bacteroidales bacterium]
MKRYSLLTYITMVMAMLLTLTSCEENDDPQPIENTIGRAVLVYMAANNNLSGFDSDDIKEMLEAAGEGAFGENRLVVYHHSSRNDPALKEVTADGLVELKVYDKDESAVSSVRMRRVIDDFRREARAEHYGLILWSHGSGWEQNGMTPDEDAAPASAPQRAFGIDRFDGRNYSMNITTLADVLSGYDFDFVYFDCCHMAGVEVAYQLRNVTSRVIGSVTELPSEGMPYQLTLPFLMKDEADTEGAAEATFTYFDSYTGVNRTCTMSVIDTSCLDRLAEAVAEVYALHPTLPAGYQPQKFIRYNCYFFDLGHYLEAFAENGDERLKAAVRNAQDALEAAVVYKGATPYIWEGGHDVWGRSIEVELKSHCGLSTYILDNLQSAGTFNYDTLDWYTDVVSFLF